MKRDEKNLMSRRKILDSAVAEFANQGYGRSSVNTICAAGELSKGILYHHFKDKDELYLFCVKELFDALTNHLDEAMTDLSGDGSERLTRYFEARLRFFREHPLYHKLFCDAVLSPPDHLAQAIGEAKAVFDEQGIAVLTELLQAVPLREDVTVETAVETFRLYQDFVHARYRMETGQLLDPKQYEQICKRSLDIFLYGVVKRGGISNEQ